MIRAGSISGAAQDGGPLFGGTGPAPLLPVLSVAAALAVFVGFVLAGLWQTGGVFEYPLDDPYIHLALAEQIAHGTYGINAGEVASPASSPLFPLLLVPFADSAAQRYLPFLWNIVGLVLTAWLWGRILFEAGFLRPGWRALGIVAAVLGPFALLMPNVALVGMEHALHAAASLAIVLGLMRYLDGRGGLWLIGLGALFASALRFEGMALGLAAAAALYMTGARRAGLATALAAVLPVLAFMGFLAMLGLEPLPSSVQSKLADGTLAGLGPLGQRLAVVSQNLAKPGGLLLAGLLLATLALWRLAPGLRDRRAAVLALVSVAATGAHLLAGQVGWLNRYENYILITAAAVLLVLIAQAARAPGAAASGGTARLFAAAGVAGLFAAALFAYQPNATLFLPGASQAINVQQGQIARFAKQFYKRPVAVNDIGLVAWHNPNYVLDLWGLASIEARHLRLDDPQPGWAGRLTAEHQVPLAMVYNSWIDEGLSPDWQRLGQLRLTRPIGYLGDTAVTFYATTPEAVAPARDAIKAWLPTLRRDSSWVWSSEIGS